jgi:hypothetical protein
MTRNDNTHPQRNGLIPEFQCSDLQPTTQKKKKKKFHTPIFFTVIYSFLAPLLCSPLPIYAEVYSTFLHPDTPDSDEFLWEQIDCTPFDELTLCWNGPRPPRKGGYAFFTSLCKDGKWSPWLYTAEWGDRGQMLYQESPLDSFAESARDVVRAKNCSCTGFRVQVFSWTPFPDNALKLIASTFNSKELPAATPVESLKSVLLSVPPRISQIGLRHPRYLDLSLPAATAAAVGQVKNESIDAYRFCESIYDCEFDFYESWIFNAAEAATYLRNHDIYATRLPNFGAIHSELMNGNPVTVNVKGYLPGCARPYRFDHMVCIYGYDADKRLVYAIDPGFPNDKASATTFPLQEFLQSWTRAGNRACVFHPRTP